MKATEIAALFCDFSRNIVESKKSLFLAGPKLLERRVLEREVDELLTANRHSLLYKELEIARTVIWRRNAFK